jgi:hypothetical protein
MLLIEFETGDGLNGFSSLLLLISIEIKKKYLKLTKRNFFDKISNKLIKYSFSF